MIPQLIVYKNRHDLDQYLKTEIKKLHINLSHIINIEPYNNREITIDQIRKVRKIFNYQIKEFYLIIFYDFDKANIEAQNAILKTLEEQTTNNLIILAVKNYYKLLPTIISRTKIIFLKDSESNLIYRKEDVEKVKKFLFDSKLISHFTDPFFEVATKEMAIYFFLLIFDLIKKFFYSKKNMNKEHLSSYPKIVKEGLNLIDLIENNNLNPQLALDNYLILIKKEIIMNKDEKKSL